MIQITKSYSKSHALELNLFVTLFQRRLDRLKEVLAHCRAVDRDSIVKVPPGYRYVPSESEHAAVHQRWLIVYSEQAYAREIRTFSMRLAKARDVAEEDLKHL